MISYVVKGDFEKTSSFLSSLKARKQYALLEQYAQKGVEALSSATPVRTGLTSMSWSYLIEQKPDTITISWTNSNFNQGVPIALVIEYGHGTPSGGYVKGRHYIKPAIQPIFDEMADIVWKEIKSL